jgi:hypothetical protein
VLRASALALWLNQLLPHICTWRLFEPVQVQHQQESLLYLLTCQCIQRVLVLGP